MEFPKTYQAAKRAEKSQWAIGDALLEEVGPPRAGARQDGAFVRCSQELAEAGMPYTSEYLRRIRNIAHNFNPGVRTPGLGIQVADAAGNPAMLKKATEYAEEQGKPVTERFVRQVKKTALRAASTKQLPQKKAREAAAETPTSELRHLADIGQLEGLAFKARRAGRDFAETAGKYDLDSNEQEVLRADIDLVIETWKIAKAALKGSIAAEAEEFLRELT